MTLVPFDELDRLRLEAFGAVVILSGPPVGDPKRVRARAKATLAEPFDGVMVELALPHSRTILAAPDRLIDLAML